MVHSQTTIENGGATLKVGAVVIGRNEGERLMKCLASVTQAARTVVYVDSGSTDDSVATARSMSVAVVNLDMAMPFTAARARNEGFRCLHQLQPDLIYVQFVDGDCEIADDWMVNAAAFLDAHKDVAVVCGRLRERHPERSIYNMLCDIEWDTALGNTKACGGNAMMRADAFDKAGGFLPGLIAGEEPELCVRLRASGWRIWRLSEAMALHDAAMTRFSQWWRRMQRSGYAYAQGAQLHGAPPERHGVSESRRAWFWALVIPAAIAVAVIGLGMPALVLLLIYPLQVIRLALRGTHSVRENWLYALFLVLGKFPEMLGQATFMFHRFMGSQSRLIEYK